MKNIELKRENSEISMKKVITVVRIYIDLQNISSYTTSSCGESTVSTEVLQKKNDLN